jgi:hypothetical protein
MAVYTGLQFLYIDPFFTVFIPDRLRSVLMASIACIAVIAGFVTGRTGHLTTFAMI